MYFPAYTTPLLAIPVILSYVHGCIALAYLTKIIVIGSVGNHWFNNNILRNVDLIACHIINPALVVYFGGTHRYVLWCWPCFALGLYIYYHYNRHGSPAVHTVLHFIYIVGGILVVAAAVENGHCV